MGVSGRAPVASLKRRSYATGSFGQQPRSMSLLAGTVHSAHLSYKDLAWMKTQEVRAWIVDYITAIKLGKWHPFTPLERLVRQATRNEAW